MTSPVFRGIWVFEKLLCGETPAVPGPVPPIEESAPADTTRERFENAHGTGACRTCHEAFEPFGFALEDFDELGRYRADENGFMIDASASALVPGVDGEVTFDGLEELAVMLGDQATVTDCVSGRLAAFAYSGGGGEACLAEPERSALSSGVYGLLEYYAQLAAAPSMTSRNR